MAGPLGNLVNSVHKAGGAMRGESAQRVAAVRLAALRPNFNMPMTTPMSLDAARPSAVNLHEHEVQARIPAPEASMAAIHNPQGLHWEDASAPVSPTLIRMARNYHREGLPVVKLWQADRNMVSIGLNPHGMPGIFFTQTMGK
jgi:hypothetical protein